MSDLAIDRFGKRGLSPRLEARAQKRAVGVRNDPYVMLGYLTESIAMELERPRWSSRDKLATDLRVIEIVRKGSGA